MLILEAVNIKKYYGDRLIVAIDNLKIHKGDKIGVVGLNGAGKSTLLNILAGETEAEEGFVNRYCDIAYVKQFSDEEIEADAKTLGEFGVPEKHGRKEVSGGELTRLKIANAVSRNPVTLFADEPTSNLDHQGLELLKQKLAQTETLLLISHDRDLIDRLCHKIIEVKDGKLSVYEGNFSAYQQQKLVETEREKFEYNQYISRKAKLEHSIIERQIQAKSMKKAPKRMGNSEARLHKGQIKEKRKKVDHAAQILRKRLSKLNVKEKPTETSGIKLDFSLTNPPENNIVISCDALNFNYGSNIIFQNTSFKVYKGLKTALIGNNGAGKTTLLNLINIRNQQIYTVPKAVCGYFYQGFENLDYNKTILENVMKDSIQNETVTRTILARLLISGDDVYKKIQVLSGGERIRVSFAKLFVSSANILLLDEPTNYLDAISTQALENVLNNYEGTVLFVSHDRAFINNVADRLLILRNKLICEFEGNLREYEEKQMDDKKDSNIEMQKTILKLRLTEIISKLSLPNSDKDALEIEFQSILAQIRQLEI